MKYQVYGWRDHRGNEHPLYAEAIGLELIQLVKRHCGGRFWAWTGLSPQARMRMKMLTTCGGHGLNGVAISELAEGIFQREVIPLAKKLLRDYPGWEIISAPIGDLDVRLLQESEQVLYADEHQAIL